MLQETSFHYFVIVFSIFFLTLLLMETTLTISYSQPIENSMMASKEGTSLNSYNINLVQNNTNEVKSSPLKQTTQGVFFSEVECKTGNVLLIKSNQNSSACATPQTAKKLIARYWGISSTTLMLSPSNEIKVESLVQQTVTKCKTKIDCIIDSIKKVADNEKKFITLRTYGGIIGWYEESLGYCHGFGHHLGMFLYDYIDDLPETLFYVDQRCGSSQFHGAVEKSFQKNFNGTDPGKIDIRSICPETFDNPYSVDRWACLHGMGHGLTQSYNYDIFSAVIRCEELDLGWEEVSCAKGLFMENVGEFLRSKGGTFDEADIFFPCNEIDFKYAPACYHYHTSYIRSQPDYTVDGAFKTCDMIEPKELVKYCYYGMGRINALNSFDNYEKAVKFCKKGDANYQKYCLTGSLLSLVKNRGTDQGFEYCQFLPIEFKEECYNGMGKWIIMLHSLENERERDCSKAENLEFSKVCINASLDDIALL